MIGKDPHKSKTLWFNVLAFLVAGAVQYGFKDFKPAPEVEPLAKGLVALVTVAMPLVGPLVNIALRFVTKEPIVLRR